MEYASLGLAGLIGYMLGWFLANIMHLGRTGLMVEKVGLQTLKLMVGVVSLSMIVKVWVISVPRIALTGLDKVIITVSSGSSNGSSIILAMVIIPMV